MRLLWIAAVLTVTSLAAMPLAQADRASQHYHKALSHKRQGDTKAAIEELRRALQAREDYAAAHHSLGMLYRNAKSFPKAIYHLERATELEPKNARARYSLALSYHKAGRRDEALEAMTKAAALDPKDHQIQSTLGTLLIRKDPRRAVSHLEAAVKVKPNDARYLQQLGLAHRKAGDDKQAEKHLIRSAALKPDPVTEFNLGVLYRRTDRQDKAVLHYEKALKLNPKLAAAYWDLAHVYAQLDRKDEAVEAYEKYIQHARGAKDIKIARERIKALKGQ